MNGVRKRFDRDLWLENDKKARKAVEKIINQYEGLEELYQTYKDQLVIIGFPCNQFLMQEPGSEEKIANFCAINYGVTFPLS